ncbi:MAG: methyltransferase domain-containing protein, partial [Chrysiogenetes bacterium]|nr:methyltransferase domain-containing protein [Chrysiogenetes bacterium]
MSSTEARSVEEIVRERYSAGARKREEALCCPVEYDPKYLKIIPEEILERDYGCGDPSEHVRAGETVLDLGSGGGKICYIAAQKVGADGHVIGVDMNDDMLTLARKYKGEMAEKLGYDVVDFRKGRIQDLALDWGKAEAYLADHPVRTSEDWDAFENWCAAQRKESPLIPDDSVDVIVSNCVLNLVREDHKRQMFAEMHRVLKRGGRVAISDIVSDEIVP